MFHLVGFLCVVSKILSTDGEIISEIRRSDNKIVQLGVFSVKHAFLLESSKGLPVDKKLLCLSEVIDL